MKQVLYDLALNLDRLDTSSKSALLGFDGFVDEVVHVVDKRIDSERYIRLDTISAYAERIAGAAGLSCNIEMVTVAQKLGGNGPILTNALIGQGLDVTYIGSIGFPAVHAVFADMAAKCRAYSVAEPGKTDAVEFLDGKIISSKLDSLNAVGWDSIMLAVGAEEFTRQMSRCHLVGFENWTMLPHMSDIWRRIIAGVLPKLPRGKERAIFFDLADPSKRRTEDLLEALELIGAFLPYFQVYLGLNEKEALCLSDAYGVGAGDVISRSERLFKLLPVDCLAVHPLKEAFTVTDNGVTRVSGPYCERPRLTTGAGDNFNAGFLLGVTAALPPRDCLLLGVAASGFYVRNARSPDRGELSRFLTAWAEGALEP
jgi:hypothetical protein